jgi:uncharacterized protein (UPF0332 family)/predicted nucleotidyltransferase
VITDQRLLTCGERSAAGGERQAQVVVDLRYLAVYSEGMKAIEELLLDKERKALDELKDALLERYDLLRLILIGSKARGDSHPESDIDVVIVLKELDSQRRDDISHLCFEVGLKHDVLLQPILYTPDELNSPLIQVQPFYKNMIADGVQLWKRDGEADSVPDGESVRAVKFSESGPKQELVRHRMDQAREALDAAKIMLERDRATGVMHMVYRAMFYSAGALLFTRDLSSHRNSGTIALFEDVFVKSGEFPVKLGNQLAAAFKVKTKDDYEAFADPQVNEVRELFAKAREFVDKVDEMIQRILVPRP